MAGLYIHIPFCESRCAYCDFYSTTSSDRMAAFLESVKREMTFRRDFLAGERVSTLYVGGGTPSLLTAEQLLSLVEHAAGLWDCSATGEATLEANPEDLTGRRADGGYLSDLKRIGFDRLSIGIQSFDDGLLRMMNRRHSAARAREAVMAAQRAGFDNISIDLIYGIPGMTARQWECTLDEAIGLGVQHISAYHLTIEPGTAFGRQRLRSIPEVESERQFETLRRKLADAGFEHYEISNFALPGRRALHNSAYWSGNPYLGIGPSAHSFDGLRRREWVCADLKSYIAGSGTNAIYEGENLSESELFNERVMTALRTADGLDTAALESRFGRRRTGELGQKAERFLQDGSLVKNGGRIAIPTGKFLLSDYIIAELFDMGN